MGKVITEDQLQVAAETYAKGQLGEDLFRERKVAAQAIMIHFINGAKYLQQHADFKTKPKKTS